jgi:outer membrane protein
MKKQIIMLLGIVVWLSQTSAALAEDPRSITLSQAVEAALTGNPDLLQSQNQLSLAQINLRQKKAGFLPELSFSASGTRTFAEAESSPGGKSTQAKLNLGLDLNLFNGFADASALKVSRLEQLMAGQDFDRSRQTIVFNTIQAYMQTLISQGLIRVEEENLAAQDMQLGVITDFHQAGKRPKADLYQQQAEMARSELLLLEAKRTDHDRKLALMQLLGQSPRSDYQVLDPGAETIITRLEAVDMERLVSQAMDKRPDLQSRRLDTRAAAEEITTAASGYWPKLSLFADLGSSFSNLRDTSLSTQLFEDQVSGSVGLSLSVPIFDKSRTASAVASARVMEKNSRLLFEKARHQVELEIRQALESYHSARQSLEVTKLQLVYARQALESIEARYRIQASTLAELISARAQWTQARYNEVQTRYTLLIRALAIAYHSGDEQAMIRLIGM